MKTRILKIGMPIMVFMMAIAFAFASASTTKAEDSALALVPTPGYIFQNGKCEQVTVCDTEGGPLCMHNGIVARTKINETQCGIQLRKWN